MANFRFRNSWSDAARTDARYRDRLDPAPAAAIAAELVDQAAAAELAPGPAANPPPSAAGTWGTFHTDRRRKITAAVLAAAVKLHQEGESWPAIARKFGCHRMSFFHALRRPPR